MRLLLTTLLCVMLAARTGMNASAQDFVATPVEISSEKVNVRGIVYYLHKVLKGHTLYSISKAYGVSQDAIREANPLLSEGLKAGMLLYIPDTAAKVETPVDTVTKEKEKPQKKKTPKPSKRYRKYNVKWYETLDDVAVKFNVSKEAIIALNGIDPESDKRIRAIQIPDEQYMRDLKEGKIQIQGNVMQMEKTEDGVADTDTGMDTLGRTSGTEVPDIATAVVPGEPYDQGTYTITLVLPFNASRLTTSLNAYTADFYAGTLIAMADLKKKGMFTHFVLNVVDLSRYSSAWELVADNALRGSELIIGPISERDMQPVASYARSERIPVVSPLDLNTAPLAYNNPWFYLFPPQSDLALSHQIDKLAQARLNGENESVTVIYEQGHEDSELVTSTIKELEAREIPYRTFSYDFLNGRGIDSQMYASLNPDAVNRVIIPSLSEAFITDALRNLNLIRSSRDCSIEVYGMSRWKSFETVELDYFHALDLRLAMSYHIDYSAPETMDFINKYKAAFNTEPTSFAFQGYDILTFFVEAMNTWGKNFPKGIINERKSLLQSDVLFLPTDTGSGYENRAFKDICFTDGWTVLNEQQ